MGNPPTPGFTMLHLESTTSKSGAVLYTKAKPFKPQTKCLPYRSRVFQYGVKYWICNMLVLCVALIASEADKPDHLASWHPLFLVATVNVVFSEKVQRSQFSCVCLCVCMAEAAVPEGHTKCCVQRDDTGFKTVYTSVYLTVCLSVRLCSRPSCSW